MALLNRQNSFTERCNRGGHPAWLGPGQNQLVKPRLSSCSTGQLVWRGLLERQEGLGRQVLVKPTGQTNWSNQLVKPTGQTNWSNQLVKANGQTNWSRQMVKPAGP
jgi:hypothetical protein